MVNSNVKFILNIEGKESIKTSGNGIENAILEIFGKNYLKNFSKFSLGYLGNANLFKAGTKPDQASLLNTDYILKHTSLQLLEALYVLLY